MAKIDTNTVVMSYAREATHGTPTTAPAEHTRLEPNDITSFGSTITRSARAPISDRLQRRKGTPVRLAAAAEFVQDLTIDGIVEFLAAVSFTKWQNAAIRNLGIASVTGDTDNDDTVDAGEFEFTLDQALASAEIAKLKNGSLLWADGMALARNNGLKELRADMAAGAPTKILVEAGDLAGGGDTATAETVAATRSATLSYAGHAISAASGRTWAYDATAREATLTLATAEVTIIKAVLKEGQIVHLGSVAETGFETLGNGIRGDSVAVADAAFGFARYTGRGSATSLVFDRLDDPLRANGDGATGPGLEDTDAIHLVYGDFLRNVSRNDASYEDVAYTLRLGMPDLFTSAATGAGLEYATGSKLGPLALTFPEEGEVSASLTFTARDVPAPVKGEINPTATPIQDQVHTNAFSTAIDFARLRMDVDADGIESDFKSLTLTIDPQITVENVLGKLGARYVNRGNLNIDVAAVVIFASDLIPRVIRNNATGSIDLVIANGDGVLALGIPGLTIGDGSRTYPANQSVTIAAALESHEDDTYQASILASLMPVPIPTDGD